MASADPPNRDIPSDDELDAIISGTYDGGDIFDTSNIDAQQQAQPSQQSGNKKSPADDVLGLEEEVKVAKKRQPVPKLDDKLLLSDLGIPKLQKISKDRLKLKGKGHEVAIDFYTCITSLPDRESSTVMLRGCSTCTSCGLTAFFLAPNSLMDFS